MGNAMRSGPLAVVTLCLLAFWLMGLGGGTEKETGSIPIPQESFTVTVADASGKSVEARRFTWEGKVLLRGQVGSATVSMPFAKLRSIKIEQGPAGGSAALVKASVTLRSGDAVEVLVERGSKCYGETKFGNYEIFFKDVASIEFQ